MPTDQVSSALIQLEIDPESKVQVSSVIAETEIQPENKLQVSSVIIQVEISVPPITTFSSVQAEVEYTIVDSDVIITSLGTQVEAIPTYREVTSLGSYVEYFYGLSDRMISSLGVQVEYSSSLELVVPTLKKYMLSVADVYGYDLNTGDLLFIGKTLLDSSIDVSTNMIDTYSGRGEAVSNIYFDSTEVTIEISDVQFSLNLLSATTGATLNTGQNIYEDENITLGLGGTGTVSKTPVSTVDGVNIYGWVTLANGAIEKVTFSGSDFTCSGSQGDCVSIRYYAYSTATRTIDINSEIIPVEIRLVLETQLSVMDMFFTNNVLGLSQIIIPKAVLSGTFNFSLTPDGVSSTPITARAIATIPEGTSGIQEMIYAQLVEVSESLYWYADVIALSFVGGDFSMNVSDTKWLDIRAIPSSGSAFKPQYEDIIFSSSNSSVASINTSGIITANSAGTAIIKATIREKQLIDANIVVTVI